MKSSLGISNFLEEISSLSHSVVFLYFFALIAEEGPQGWGTAEAEPGAGTQQDRVAARGEAKDSALLSSRDAALLEPPEPPSQASF